MCSKMKQCSNGLAHAVEFTYTTSSKLLDVYCVHYHIYGIIIILLKPQCFVTNYEQLCVTFTL